MSFRIECISKTERSAPEHQIRAIGGTKADGTPWRLSERDAISGIESGSWLLHVEGPERETVPVVVATNAGKKYLRSELDGARPTLLLALPECFQLAAPSRTTSEGDRR